MSGVTLTVEALGIEEVESRLRRLMLVGQDLTPAMNDIGEYLLRTTRDRFDSEEAPDGTLEAALREHEGPEAAQRRQRYSPWMGTSGGT